MALTRYRDPAGLFGLQRLNRILDEAFASAAFPEQGSVITSTLFAPTDVSEDENALQVTMELPGVDPDDVRRSLENSSSTRTTSGSIASSVSMGCSSGPSRCRTRLTPTRSRRGSRTASSS
jgi:hypothetical protein